MSANDDDIRVRIAGDLADINRAIQELRNKANAAGRDAENSGRGWASLGKTLDGLRSRVAGLVGAYLSFRGVQTVFRAVIQNTIEAERVSALLEARIKSTGAVAGFTADQLLQLADDFQKVTTFGDEAIATAETLLLTFSNIRGDNFVAATEAALNLSTALGTDLESAVTQVGKALNDPVRGITALNRAGVQFTGQQRALIKQLVETGDVLGAQRVILEALEVKFGGAARAARDTFGGAIAGLKNTIGNLLEGKGGSLSEATSEIEDLTKLLQDPQTVAAFDALTAAVLRLVAAGAQFSVGFVNVGQTIGEVVARLNQSAFGVDVNLDDQLSAVNAQIKESQAELRVAQVKFQAFDRFFDGRAEKARENIKLLQTRIDILNRARRLFESGEGARGAAEPFVGPPVEAAGPTPSEVEQPVIAVDARPALKELQASLAAAGKLLDAELKRVGAGLDAEFEDNLIRFGDYYKRRAALEQQAIDQQLKSQRAALQLLDEEIKLAGQQGDDVDEAALEEKENKRKELVAEITVLEQQRGDVATKAARQQVVAERALADQLASVRSRLLELQGDNVGARSAELEAEFRDLMQRLATEGDVAGQELVERLINVELARVRLEDLQTEYERTLAELQRAEQRVETQVETGVIGEREGRRQIIGLHQKTAAELERLIPLMRELAAATGDPEAIERLKDLELEVEELGKTADVVAREMSESFRDAGENAVSSLLDQTATGKDAIEGFLDDIRRRFADLAAEQLMDQIFTGDGGPSGTGFFAKIAGFFGQMFHEGGIAGEDGTPRWIPAFAIAHAPRFHSGGLAGDEIAAVLQRGEEVLTEDDPRHRNNMGRDRRGGDTINVSVATPDGQSFVRRNRGQLSAEIGNGLIRARNRNGR